ncbi:MAG TPA: carboxypeptidase-like regulatory domain-containing protein [Longimicrobium sp.]|nr:carboxypeptidase-like regulatory domain-containing protein [Longimicrobium sp.]
MSRSSILLLALACLLPAGAAAQAARVLGRVTDGVGNPVAGAVVTLVPADSGRATLTTASGPTGGFELRGVQPGDYTVRAERAGFAAREQAVTVRPDRITTTVVRLRASGRGGRASAEVAARGGG